MRTYHLEETINSSRPDLLERVSEWVAGAQGRSASVGTSVANALSHADSLRQRLVRAECDELCLDDSEDTVDVLHALCRSLTQDCADSPRKVLDEASALSALLEASQWQDDELGEREGLLCSLAFIAWRAAGILGLSKEVQRYESKYRQIFRSSVEWEVAQATWETQPRPRGLTEDLIDAGPEAIFQALLYFQDQFESSPRMVAASATALYHSLQIAKEGLSADLRSLFLGSSAWIVGTVSRGVETYEEASHWLDVAEDHFRTGPNPEPHLARVTYQRLTILYMLNRFDTALRVAPALDAKFAEYGMEEDQVKCRIVWASCLKCTGDCEEALQVLEPIRSLRPRIPPGLYGWVLMQFGDTHQVSGEYQRGFEELTEAAHLLRAANQLTGLAICIAMIGFGYRAQGMPREALELFRSSRREYARLGATSLESYIRLLIAETYLAMGRWRQAEMEIRDLLPIFEKQGMVPEGVAGVTILREAIRRRNLEIRARRALRQRLGIHF